jgi:peroxiredoxin
MRRLMVVLALVAALAVGYRLYASPATGTGSLTLPPPAPIPGQDAPNFTAERQGGGIFSLSERGTYVIAFWDTLSYYSKQSKPYFRKLAENYSGDGARFVVVYVDNPPEDEVGSLPYEVVWDRNGRLASFYNVKRVPRLFIVKDGTVRMTYDDFSPEGYEEVRKTLEEVSQPPP